MACRSLQYIGSTLTTSHIDSVLPTLFRDPGAYHYGVDTGYRGPFAAVFGLYDSRALTITSSVHKARERALLLAYLIFMGSSVTSKQL